MMNDSFDNFFKRKLNSIDPEFSDEAWNSFTNYRSVSNGGIGTYFNKHVVFYSLLIGLLTCLSTYLYQLTKNTSLEIEKTASLKNRLAELELANDSLVSIIASKSVFLNYEKSSLTRINNESKNSFNNAAFDLRAFEQNHIYSNGSPIYSSPANNFLNLDSSAFDTSQFFTNSEHFKNERSYIDVDYISSSESGLTLKQVKDLYKISTRKKGRATASYYSVSTDRKRLDFGFLHSIANSQRSSGLVAEYRILPEFKVGIGLVASKYDEVRFFNDIAFRDRTRELFRGKYGATLPPHSEVLNIELETRRIQVPVTIAHILPLKNDYHFRLSSGVDLNLAGKQIVRHDVRIGNLYRNVENLKFEDKNRNLVQAINLSAGLEKRINKLTLRADLFYNHNLNDLPFTNLKNQVGVKMQILTSL